MYDRPAAIHPHEVAIDTNDGIYDLVRDAVARAVDGLEPALQAKIEQAINNALALSDDLLLEYMVCLKNIRLVSANAWTREFIAYRHTVWHDRLTEKGSPLTIGDPTLTQETQ